MNYFKISNYTKIRVYRMKMYKKIWSYFEYILYDKLTRQPQITYSKPIVTWYNSFATIVTLFKKF